MSPLASELVNIVKRRRAFCCFNYNEVAQLLIHYWSSDLDHIVAPHDADSALWAPSPRSGRPSAACRRHEKREVPEKLYTRAATCILLVVIWV